MKLEDLRKEIVGRIESLTELYNYYLDTLDKNPYDLQSIERLNSLRIEIITYQRILRLIDLGEE